MIEDVRKRLDSIEYDYEKMNPYTLFFDCKYLLAEVNYWKARCLESEKILDDREQHNWYALSIANRDYLIRESMK